jgi:hypothetical protein
MDRGSRTKLVTALVLGAVFGSGLLLGFAADSPFDGDVNQAAVLDSPRSSEAGGERPRRPMVYEQLHPSPDQTAVIDSIMTMHRQRMNALDKEYREARHLYQARYDALIQETRAAIAGVFPPEVATEYRRLLAEFDERRAAERAAEQAPRR